ncbi:MAG: Transcriptional regulatory protein LiaR [Anaerolineales bacterium]|nr:Transcriptional regulatory protein LiaR [Anaerolineales bacterium]
MKPVEVLVVDDHALFREGLVGILNAQPDLEVVGEASDAEAVAWSRAGRGSYYAGAGRPDDAGVSPAEPAAGPSDEELEALTPREQEVLNLVAEEGATDQEIAEALSISVHTVKTHMRNILAKLHVNSRHEAATYARRKGLV